MAYAKLSIATGLSGRAWRMLGQRWQPIAVHRHRELEINLATDGWGVYLVGERRLRLEPGSLLWLFPRQDHLLIDASEDFQMWIAVFRPKLVSGIARGADAATLRRLDPGEVLCRQLRPEAAGRLSDLCADVAAADADPALHNVGLGYLLLNAWSMHRHAGRDAARSSVHPAIEQAAMLLRDEAEPMKLAVLADRCGLSPSRLSRLFKAQVGVGLAEFRNRRRIERFFALRQRQPNLTMMAAALTVGFGSYPQFHRVFRRMVGCSPAQFLRRSRTASAPGKTNENQ